MTCIIVDDEPLARQGMELNIANVSTLQLLGSFSNALAASDFLRKQNVGLMFLDINMPELSGLDFLKSLREAPMVIFTTAYPQYALESYELEAIDYLVKPIRIERFLKAVNKAENYLKLLQQDGNNSQVERIEDDYVFIKADRKFFKIYFKDILYIEGLKDYVKVYTQNSIKPVLSLTSLKLLESKLPENKFMRVHRSFIVNLEKIDTIERSRIVFGKEYIPVSDQYKDKFQEFLDKNFL